MTDSREAVWRRRQRHATSHHQEWCRAYIAKGVQCAAVVPRGAVDPKHCPEHTPKASK